MKISLIAAMAENRAIGRDQDLPWRVPTDFKYFKDKSMGKPLIMGRKSWEALGGPLPGRKHIVITRDPAYTAEGADVVHDLPTALRRAAELAAENDAEEIMIGGGSQIYAMALPMADRIYLTEIHLTPEGADTFFPEFDMEEWQETQRTYNKAGPKDDADCTFIVYDRKTA